jgi:hypothetical protein
VGAAYIFVIFAVVFGIIMGAVGLGYVVLETQRKKQVQGVLTAVAGVESAVYI